ncbi:MAG: ABC transporter permease [archaeon]
MIKLIKDSYAVALRDWMKKEKLRDLIISFLFIVGIIYIIGFGIEKIVSTSLIASYSSFFSFGMIIYFVIFTGVAIGSEIIFDTGGYIKVLLVAPISKYSILFGKALSFVINSIKFYFVIGIVFLFLTKNFSFLRLLFLPLYLFFVALTGIAIGILLSTITSDRKKNQYIVGVSSFVILFLSGIVFPSSQLPKAFQVALQTNPIVFITDGFRHLMIGTGEYLFLLDLAISLSFMLLAVFVSVQYFDRSVRK